MKLERERNLKGESEAIIDTMPVDGCFSLVKFPFCTTLIDKQASSLKEGERRYFSERGERKRKQILTISIPRLFDCNMLSLSIDFAMVVMMMIIFFQF